MAEKEYIERGALIAEFDAARRTAAYEFIRGFYGHIIQMAKRRPAADVVEVVRCKDCKYYEEGIIGYSCFHPKQERGWNSEGGECLEMKPYDFCSYGIAKMDGKVDNDDL